VLASAVVAFDDVLKRSSADELNRLLDSLDTAAFAQATEIGRSVMALPREHDDFLRVKAPPVRVERFNMSSRSDAT